jgi:hypothetical protein
LPPKDIPERTGHGWFAWTPLRELRHYPEFENTSTAGFHPEDPGEHFCRKETVNTGTQRKTNPGVMFGLCPHGIVYGFHLMAEPEGRKDIFYVIWRYWPKDMVDKLLIIFDFGCQQDEYFFNREPEFFARCRVFIDKFHGKGHTCSPLYHLTFYPTLQTINTSVVEQFNPFHNSFGYVYLHVLTLTYYSPQLSCMRSPIAVRFMKYVYGYRNKRNNQKLQQGTNYYQLMMEEAKSQ